MSNKKWLPQITPSKLFFGKYFFFIIALLLYSYTQVDLGLTMTRASFATEIQRAFQYIGYFNRPLSSTIFCILLIVLFLFYLAFMSFAQKKLLTKKTVWITVIVTGVLMMFSYNAFSYDIFNYIFDAKILTHYHLNPYLYKALDFPTDPMLAFMHWTHRTYPYGPVWLGISLPLSYLGMQFFLPTFFLFKVLVTAAFLGTTYAIGRIVRLIAPEHELLSIVFFALNPLVIVESLVSGHNDIVMMCIGMFSILFLIQKRFILSFLLLILSIGVKYATGFLLPLFIVLTMFMRKKVKIIWEQIVLIFLISMTFAMLAAVMRSNFQPWYLLFLLPIASLLANKAYMRVITVILSLAGLLNYLPYLYTGNWDNPIPMILVVLNLSAVILSFVVIAVYYFKKNPASKKV